MSDEGIPTIRGTVVYKTGKRVAVVGKPNGHRTRTGLAIWIVTELDGGRLPGRARDVASYEFGSLPARSSVQVSIGQ